MLKHILIKPFTILLTVSLISSNIVFPSSLSSGGLKFGIISAIQDRTEELEEKRIEKEKKILEEKQKTDDTVVITSVNQAPYTPSSPNGPTKGLINTSYTFTVSAADPEADDVQYQIDWGDGNISNYTPLVNSGSSAGLTYAYSTAGTYNIKAQARDDQGLSSAWSAAHTIVITVPAPSNQPPNTPVAPAGPAAGLTGSSYMFSATATDPDGDQVQYLFDWGDGSISNYTPLVNSGNTASLTHVFAAAGTYDIKAQAQDSNGATSGWSAVHSIVITVPPIPNNAPNTPDTPTGPSSGLTEIAYNFTTSATDPDGDQVQYRFDWGDGNISGYSPLAPSGSPVLKSHIYTTAGTYNIKAQAMDSNGATSAWSNSFSITISRMKWAYNLTYLVYSSPAIGSDGTIYVGSVDDNLYAINHNGSIKWKYTANYNIESSPAIGSDGTIYVGTASTNGKLYAINPNGTLKWEYQMDSHVRTPAIDSNGIIYVGCGSKLYAFNPNGTKKWEFPTGNWVQTAPAIGSDGTIYIPSCDYRLYAINPDGTMKWNFYAGQWMYSSPAIDSNGTIYVSASDALYQSFIKFYAINPNGTLKWELSMGEPINSSPAIGSNGTIYVGTGGNYTSGSLYAINSDGTIKWKFKSRSFQSSPAIGSDGTIYVGSYDSNFYAVNPDGTEKWSFKTGDKIYSSPAIASDGTIYFGSHDRNLYALQGSCPLANTPWPMHLNNPQHTGRQ